MVCVAVGDANPDIAGIGILLSFAIQAFIAVIVSMYAMYLSWIPFIHQERREYGTETQNLPVEVIMRRHVWEEKCKLCREILLQGSDTQIVTGFALLLSAIIQYRNLSLYHLHVIYDAVSLVSISICASNVCSLNSDTKHRKLRYGLIAVWSIFFLVYISLFEIRLKSWDESVEGYCYSTVNLTRPQDAHPLVDHVYVAITSFYLVGNIFVSMIPKLYGSPPTQHARRGRMDLNSFLILCTALLQFPLHSYSLIVLRISNEKLLKGGTTEREWGFGQIAAMLVLGGNLLVLINGLQDYKKWKTESGSCDAQNNRRTSVTSLEMGDISQQA